MRLSAETVRARDTVTVSVDLTSSGPRAGEEVVQLYLRDDAASVTPVVRALKGFRRLPLERGETRTVTFTLRPQDFALYDQAMRTIVEPGTFTVFVGGSSTDGLKGRFRVVGDTLILSPKR